MHKRPPRARPLTLAALVLVAGLVRGLGSGASLLLPLLVIAAAIALAAIRRESRLALTGSALVILSCGGLLLGANARRHAGLDCRLEWESGARVRIAVLAIGYLPQGEDGIVRVRPLSRPRAGRRPSSCRWNGALRVLAYGPVRPGVSYSLRGVWQPAKRPGRGPRPPERTGWVTAERLDSTSTARLSIHPLLALRGSLAERLWRLYPRRWAPLALALVLGQREVMSPETVRRMGRAGLAHLLAISGLHVGMIAGALFSLARMLRLRERGAHLATIVLTLLYVGLIGAPASAVRAALMVGLWSLSRLAGRSSSPFDVLGLAAIVLLLARSWSVMEPGFQLSFAGAASVGWASREIGQWTWLHGRARWMRVLAGGAFASAAAVLLTAPISAAYFGRVAPAAVLGNLLAVPLLALAMPALFVSAILVAWPLLAGWSSSAAITVLWMIDRVAGMLAGASWSSFEVAPPSLAVGVLYTAALILATHALHGAFQRRRLILFLGLLWSGAILAPTLRLPFDGERLEVFVLDVGQGDALAVRTPGGRWFLVDAGPDIQGFDAGRSRLVPFFRERGVGRLEAWIASHPDLDHVGGGAAVLDALDVRRVIGIGWVTGQIGQIEVLRRLAASHGRWLSGRSGGTLQIEDVELLFLHPPDLSAVEGEVNANELSLVFRLQYGDFRMLFTGDLPGEIEERLTREWGDELEAQVLKVAHHGSASSSRPRFIAAVHPGLAVISAGRGNVYGHPSPLALSRLVAAGAEVHRTDREGTLAIVARRDGTWQIRSAAQAGW
jgi:competence protein ComEC